MRSLITNISKKHNYFGILIGGRQFYFYLPKRMSIVFMPMLEVGQLIDFEALENTKTISKRKAFEVSKINEIATTNPHHVIYSLKSLQKDMAKVLFSYDYFLCVDFEMSMAGYKQKGYKAEIIQAGMVLVDRNGDVIKKMSKYILPVDVSALNRRTLKFLNLDFNDYLNSAVEYIVFYDELKEIMHMYKPKIVIWGKNDKLVLADSYQLNKVRPITDDKDFIDLLKLHKNYYSIKDDIGLFKAYSIYYKEENKQTHDALEDASVTKDILIAFLGVLAGEEIEE